MLPTGLRGQQLARSLPPYCWSPEPSRELLVPEMLRVLRRRSTWIISCTIVGLLLAEGYVLLRRPRYEARAQIEVSPPSSNGMGWDELADKSFSSSDAAIRLQTAVEVIESDAVALDVMDQLGMGQRRDFAGKWRQPEGATVADAPPAARDHLLARFRKGLAVEVVPKTDILSIGFRTTDPGLAANVANTAVEKYKQRNLRTSYQSASEVSDWLAKQLEGLKAKARDSQEQLAALERTSGLLGQDETDNIVFGRLKQLDEEFTSSQSDRILKEARYRIAAAGNPELLATSAPDATLQVLRTQQAGLRLQYAQMSSKFGQGYPKLAELGDQLTNIDAAVDRQLKDLTLRYSNEYQAALHSEQMLHADFEQQKQRAFRLNEDAAQHAILKHEVESTQQLYETLQLKLKQAGIAAGLASANIALIDAARVPSEPVEPKPLTSGMVGLGSGLLLGLTLTLVAESMDDAVTDVEEAEQTSALPCLGAIPLTVGERRTLLHPWPMKQYDPEHVVTLCHPRSPAAESYRGVANNLSLLARATTPRILMTTSAMAGEGKTVTAMNCAVALAQQGGKVLLVDGDLRRPCIHKYFGCGDRSGLAALLKGEAALEEAVFQLADLPGLSVLAVGDRRSEQALAVEVKSLLPHLEAWRGHYDHVIIDTPPVSVASDALVLASHADAVLLIVRSEATTRRALQRTCDVLHRADANLVGFVLNAARPDALYGHRHAWFSRPVVDDLYAGSVFR